jgi:TonB family protein
LFAVVILFGALATARAQETLEFREWKMLARYTPPPQYPYAARAKRWTGSGIAMLDVDRNTGRVTSAHMEPSTGYKILDDAALNAFRQWRFTPGMLDKVRLPISFVMAGGVFAAKVRNFVPLQGPHRPVRVHSVSRGRDAIAIYTVGPNYPAEARARHLTGNGAVIVELDAKTGTVTNAYMNPSTGHAALDEAALAAFRRWRFKPGPGGKFKLPVTYEY